MFRTSAKDIQYCSVSERRTKIFKVGYAHMHIQVWKGKAPVNIPVMCKIKYTVNKVVLLDMKYVEVIIHMPVIHIVC